MGPRRNLAGALDRDDVRIPVRYLRWTPDHIDGYLDFAQLAGALHLAGGATGLIGLQGEEIVSVPCIQGHDLLLSRP